jgi:hypothetical protein
MEDFWPDKTKSDNWSFRFFLSATISVRVRQHVAGMAAFAKRWRLTEGQIEAIDPERASATTKIFHSNRSPRLLSQNPAFIR